MKLKIKPDQQRCLTSFIGHPNGTFLCALKKSLVTVAATKKSLYTSTLVEAKKLLVPSFIYHPNKIVLRDLNQKQSQMQSLSCYVVISNMVVIKIILIVSPIIGVLL